MPPESLRALARGLIANQHLHEVTTHNLANQNTAGMQAYRTVIQQNPEDLRPDAVTILNRTQGPIEATGRGLDVALSGPGYLVVDTEAGERLTRGGSLSVAPSGVLVGPSGHPVLGEEGLILVGDEEILLDGRRVLVGGEEVDRLRVEAPELDPEPIGDGLAVTDGPLVDDPETVVLVGAVEGMNVDPILSLMDIMRAGRDFQTLTQALGAVDGTVDQMVNQIGRVR